MGLGAVLPACLATGFLGLLPGRSFGKWGGLPLIPTRGLLQELFELRDARFKLGHMCLKLGD